jgi:hypothetical protein
MNLCTHPRHTEAYRQVTANQTMVGVTCFPKREKCICCEKQRTAATGTQTAKGFVCGMCDGAWARGAK